MYGAVSTGGIKVLVTPLLELRGGRLLVPELVPGGAGCVVLRPGGVATLRVHPAVHGRNVLLGNLVPWSWRATAEGDAQYNPHSADPLVFGNEQTVPQAWLFPQPA